MSCTIALGADERKALLDLYRRGRDPEVARRAHLVLLLAEGYPWDTLAAVLFTSTSTIARWQQRFPDGGLEALAGRRLGRRPWFPGHWAGVVARLGYRALAPRDFGVLRSRWTCAIAATSASGAVVLLPAGRQPGDGPPLAAPRRPGVATSPARPAAARPAPGRETAGVAATTARPAGQRGGRLRG